MIARLMRNRIGVAALMSFAGLCASGCQAIEALRVCLNEDAPPYSRREGAGGFDMAVAKALAAKLGRSLEVQWFESKLDGDSSGALEANALLSDGHCQLVAGYPLNEDTLGKPGMPSSRLPDFDGLKPKDRKRRIVLGELQPSKAYHSAALAVIVGAAGAKASIAGLGDLSALKIGVEGGTLSDTILMTYAKGKLIDDISHVIPGRDQLWPGLESGAFEATLAPVHRFDAYRAQHPDTKLKASNYLFPLRFNFGFVGLKNDTSLMQDVDGALVQLLAGGDIAALAAKSGMTYLPPSAPDVHKHIMMSDLTLN